MSQIRRLASKFIIMATSAGIVVGCATGSAPGNESKETHERVAIAAANMKDALVIDCQLPGKLVQLGGIHNYMTPGQLLRLSAIDCQTRGGEYTIGDLASGTLSLQRWLPLADKGQAEAQYYVARIYANGMGIPADYAKAAEWYQKAAAQNYPSAVQELGYLYEKGLGVQQDRLRALNLQRQASGLGDDLDYAWKLTATKEDAAKEVAAMSDRLESSNAELESLRGQLASTSDKLSKNRNRLAQSETAVINLRAQLLAAQQDGTGRSATHVKDLETQLAEKQAVLNDAQANLDKLRTDVADQQNSISARLTKSQATSLELNELLAARQSENSSLRARLAQSEQRLIRSQQELSDLRLGYRREVEELATAHEELDQIRAKGKTDGGAALIAAKQRDLDRQQIRVQALEAELSKLQHTPPVVPAMAARTIAESQAQNGALRDQLASLQTRTAQQLFQSQRQELEALRSKTQEERAAVVRTMSEQLAARGAELEKEQRRIASLETDANELRGEVAQFRDQRSHESSAALSEAERLRETLRLTQQKLADQRDQLDHLKTEAAAEVAGMVKDRETLRVALANSQQDKDREVASLQANIHERELIIAAKQQRIAALEHDLATKPTMVASNVTFRDPGAEPKISADSTALVPTGTANYFALVIGNSNYRYMGALATPANDAQTIADLLEQRYAFKVKLLLDATSDQIMRSLHDYTLKMTETDRLMIYYAGHGGTKNGPPERAFWLGVDADPETEQGFLSAESIKDKIKQMKAMHVLLVADSCFSASITHLTTTSVGPKPGMDPRKFQVQWNHPARMVLTSGQNTPVVDSTGDRRHSLFAKYFIQILRQNDAIVSGQMLSYELSSRMQVEATELGLKQTPTYSNLQDANHKNGDFFFVPAPVTTKVAALSP